MLLPLSCIKEEASPVAVNRVPNGEPVMLKIGFNVPNPYDVKLGTKSEASRADEARVHDLYVMLFDQSGNKFYGRYFTYEHLSESLSILDGQDNEGWYVENGENSVGAVKIATVSKENCTLVVLANVSNTITSLNGEDPVECLYEISTWSELQDVRVTLEQEVVNRSDLFLMMDYNEGVDTGVDAENTIKWGTLPDTYSTNPTCKIDLKILDAKIKFYITYDKTDYLDKANSYPRYWKAFNVPTESYLFARNASTSDVNYFHTESTYFEGVEVIHDDVLDRDVEWQVFSFYMLENLQSGNVENSIESAGGTYYWRELQNKMSTVNPETGFKDNLDYIYAPQHATYVQFDLVLGLTPEGIQNIDDLLLDDIDLNVNHALTSEAKFTIHMGDFNDPTAHSGGHNYDDYDVKRGHSYSYYVNVVNTSKIYLEVVAGTEEQPAQEGSLLLATDDIVNCDAHYEYYALTFNYSAGLVENGVSWYVKTPFVKDGKGGAQWNDETKDWDFDCEDYLWIKFAVNDLEGGVYREARISYPGYNEDNPSDPTYSNYDPDWEPDATNTHPALMDIHQLIKFIFNQTAKHKAGEDDLFDNNNQIIVTAFIDEYYYEKHPATKEKDPDLWRQFVNAEPRELHILSNAQYSADGTCDVITSSHSIIQQSIQTFYNIYSPDLSTIWGTEHVDEMSYPSRHKKDPSQEVWGWWPEHIDGTNHVSDRALPTDTVPNNDENGRYNTAAIWGVTPASTTRWDTFIDYSVSNTVPELRKTPTDYQYLAYSCLTRNRDNNGDGYINPNELRWYIASVNQLVGLWVGNESVTPSARLYQPKNKKDKVDGLQWRSWVVSSTASSMVNPETIRAEEGATKSFYNVYNWAFPEIASGAINRHEISSIRCVRNIGTYLDGGELKDISEAPFDLMVDQYYDAPAGLDANGKVQPNADGTYTLNFFRLNPKSLRGYTLEDLPYHEEYSTHNCVYLELNAQAKNNLIIADGTTLDDEDDINLSITSSGHNNYCPSGYRLPNMTEMLLMVAMLPGNYWANSVYPTRTYYSRGMLGSNVTDSEDEKIGWGYTRSQDRFHLLDNGTHMTGIRCVRDNNRTGDITGKITVPAANRLRRGEDFTANLNFTSMGSAIKTINIYLVYTDENGDIVTNRLKTMECSTASVMEDVTLTVPNIPVLGNMSLRAEVINSAAIRRTFETPVKIMSEVFASVRLMPCEYDEHDETPSFPVLVTASSPDLPIESWKLVVRDPYGDVFEKVPDSDPRDANHWSVLSNYTYTINESNRTDLLAGTYSFQLEVTTGTGASKVTTKSDIATMEILKLDYQPNTGVAGIDYNTAEDIENIWEQQKVSDIYFFNGDFIEANMDVSNCTYLEVLNDKGQRDNDKTIGRDNLISIGITDTDHTITGMRIPYVCHIYYPAQEGAHGYVRPNITTSAGASNGYNYVNFTGGTGTGLVLATGSNYKPDVDAKQHFRMDKNGIFWNNQKMYTSNWTGSGTSADAATESLARILNSNTLYVGATQGYHRTRAWYHFVRVVHNSSTSNPSGGEVDFGSDPVPGGNL